MKLVKFTRSHYYEYSSWFQDRTMKKILGGIDMDWLEHILSDQGGDELVAIENGIMVGVVGVTFPVKAYPYYVITNLAVHPDYRRNGIGANIMHLLKGLYQLKEGEYWVTYVHVDNAMAQDFMDKLGWIRGDIINDMITYTKSWFNR